MNRSQRNAPTIFLAGCLFILLVVAIQLWPTLDLYRGVTHSLVGTEQWALAGANIIDPAAQVAAVPDPRNQAADPGTIVAAPPPPRTSRRRQDASRPQGGLLLIETQLGAPQTSVDHRRQAFVPLTTDALRQIAARPLPADVPGPDADELPNEPPTRLPQVSRSVTFADQTGADEELRLDHHLTNQIQANGSLPKPALTPAPASSPAMVSDPDTGGSPASPWPSVPALRAQLAAQSALWSKSWASQVERTLDQLQGQTALDSQTAVQLLQRLDGYVSAAKSAASRLPQQADQALLRRVVYALERRLIVWRQISRNATPALATQLAGFSRQLQPEPMLQVLRSVDQSLQGQPDNWQRFLSLAHVRDVATSSSFGQPAVRTELAIKLLNRMSDTEFSDAQRQVMDQPAMSALQNELRRWATQPADLHQLLAQLEAHELEPLSSRAVRVTAVWNQLRWSLAPAQRQLAQSIDTHYRNANIRFAITEEFLNRLVPAIQDVQAPVREQILGANVRGQSATRTRFRVNLVPDDAQIRLQLEGAGVMSAKTESTKGGVTLMNRNRARFFVQKVLLMDPRGLRVGQAQSAASGSTNLTGLKTRFDTLPIVGSLVRKAAQKQAFQARETARSEFEHRVATRARTQMDDRLQQQVAKAQQQLQERLIEPMERLELNPTALAMETTEDRMTLRGRLASAGQLASFTARPQARSDSLLSIQVHESAMNNFAAQLELEGRQGDLQEVFEDIVQRAGMREVKLPEEAPDGVKIRLAATDPVRFQFQDGRIRIDIRFAGLKYERRAWKNFEVRAHYIPHIDGFRCDLHRDEHIELIGSMKPRHQVALRAIFTKVLSKNRPITLIHPELGKDPRLALLDVSQFVVCDGWVGVSVGHHQPPPTPHATARRTSSRTHR